MNSNNQIIVKGDVSGIQNFIFNVKSGGAAKELKGRSFFIKLLVEVAIKYLIDRSNVKDIEETKISTSGGNFIIKLPKNNEDKVLKAQHIFTKALQFTGLNISIVSIDYEEDNSCNGNYKNTIQKLNAKSRESKLRFFATDPNFFTPNKKEEFENTNSRETGGRNVWAVITNLIRTNKYFEVEKEDNAASILLNINDEGLSLAGYRITFNKEKGYDLEDYLESLFPLSKHRNIKPFSSKKKSDETLEKSRIFDNNCNIIENGGNNGINKLGILAMDVDNLGNMIEKIKDEKTHKDFDKMLSDFFNIELRNIINKTKENIKICKKMNGRKKWYKRNGNNKIYFTESIPKFKDKVYTVTAGGDDSFYVGKWNTMLDLAIKINKTFEKKFEDKGISISAGLIIIDPKFPVIRFASLAEKALKKAKYSYKTKGNICLFDEVVTWKTLDDIYKLRAKFRKSKTTGGLLAKARNTAIKGINENKVDLKDFWEMGYYLRNTNGTIFNDIKDYIFDSLDTTKATTDLQKRNYRLITPIAARLAEFDKRS